MEQTEEEKKNAPVDLLDIRGNVSVADVTKNIRDSILEGRVDAAKAGVVIKRMANICENLKEDKAIKAVVHEATLKYMNGGKTAEFFGAKVIEAATYTWYDFTKCKHPVYDALKEIMEEVKSQMKDIEEEMKLLIKKDNKDIKPNPATQGNLDLGIDNTTKDIIIKAYPKLVWENGGDVATIEPPLKMQTIGLKYMKV